MSETMQRVLSESGRQLLVGCPGCRVPVGLWLRVLESEEAKAHREKHGLYDVTASLVPPGDRQAAMQRATDLDGMGEIIPWVSCIACGYDEFYTIGSTASFSVPKSVTGSAS